MCEGKSGIRKLPKWADEYPAQVSILDYYMSLKLYHESMLSGTTWLQLAGYVDFDPKANGLKGKTINRNGRYTHFALVAAKEAIKDSGLDLETINKVSWTPSLSFNILSTISPLSRNRIIRSGPIRMHCWLRYRRCRVVRGQLQRFHSCRRGLCQFANGGPISYPSSHRQHRIRWVGGWFENVTLLAWIAKFLEQKQLCHRHWLFWMVIVYDTTWVTIRNISINTYHPEQVWLLSNTERRVLITASSPLAPAGHTPSGTVLSYLMLTNHLLTVYFSQPVYSLLVLTSPY